MVTLRFRPERLVETTGIDLDIVEEALFRLKCETELNDNYLSVEINPDRPDMFISEGIARAVRGIESIELGWTPLDGRLRDSGLELVNEMPGTRPYIAAAVVYNVNVDSESFLEELVQFQEKLHDTVGRRRRKVAIGFHDLSKVKSKRLRYGMLPLKSSMVPLGRSEPMPIAEVLRSTEQGVKYGNISLAEGLHPAFTDDSGAVLSLPPVINSELTRVEVGTRDLLIDVTGTDLASVLKVLDIITLNLAERRGTYIGLVRIVPRTGEPLNAPVLKSRELSLDINYVNRVLGTDLTVDEVVLSLLKMRHIASPENDHVKVMAPPFRYDIISEIDLVEDVAMALGYDSPKLSPSKYMNNARGSLLDHTLLSRAARDIMTGLGFTEVMSYILTSSSLLRLFDMISDAVELKNPVQEELDVLRPSLIPQLLQLMFFNVSKTKPVNIFEIGKTVKKIGSEVVEDLKLAAATMDDTVSYEDVQAVAYAFIRSFGLKPSAKPLTASWLLAGRSASLLANGHEIGVIGEISPVVLDKLNVTYPVAVFELSLTELLKVIRAGAAGQEP
ncbi:phenylalanine--tRNA ligase subunit beta [Acidilobus sp.]|jgi:phenylalanyl-tRNA synthetase beta chain|uniref:phenylalanine--tRNA ligase subunit beta n=1 Tax=Acidilobus sp. TaxID=1872109 RepID=UPI003D028AF6